MSEWTSDITDYRLLTQDKVQFAFQQFRQCHLNTLENKKQLEQKALAIIGVLVTISTAALGFLASHCDLNKPFQTQDWGIILPTISLLLLFYWAMYLVIRSLCPVKYFPPGNEPQMVLTQDQFDQPLAWMIYAEAHNMQERITTNDAFNEKKAIAIQRALTISAFAPLVSVILFALLRCWPAILRIRWFA